MDYIGKTARGVVAAEIADDGIRAGGDRTARAVSAAK
jgi:hypothetical protein